MGLKRAGGGDGLREVFDREFSRSLEGLKTQLREGDPGQRRWAARDLGAHPEAVPALGARLLQESDPTVCEAIFTALKTIASPAAAQALMPLLRSDDATLRNGAIDALSGMPQAIGPHIDRLLADPDTDVRIFTVNLMSDLKHPKIAHWLDQVLRHESAINVVATALDVLAEVGTPENLPALEAAKRRFADDPFIGFAADMAAGQIEAT